jgi:RAQPRD family integrative conjugative element protein
MINKKTLSLVSIIMAFQLNTAHADIWAERQALANIETELAALEALVMTARMRSNSSDRTTFDYELLIEDMRKIRSGIVNHLSVPMEPIAPRTIDALSSEYTEHSK